MSAPDLALVTDLDGTLIPFVDHPEDAVPTPATRAVLRALLETGAAVVVSSGRPRSDLDRLFPGEPGLVLAAEHGAWLRTAEWRALITADASALDRLADDLDRLVQGFVGMSLERKQWSIAIHLRPIADELRDVAFVAASAVVDAFVHRHPEFSRLEGNEVIEVRPVSVSKRNVLDWLRASQRTGPIVVLGDDTTDEDMFMALGGHDAGVRIGESGPPSLARFQLPDAAAAQALLTWIVAVRHGEPAQLPKALETVRAFERHGLLVISNRLPELRSAGGRGERRRNVGGLVNALTPILEQADGVWLGWSGRTCATQDRLPRGMSHSSRPALAWVDLPETWRDHYYDGLCNGALWPLLHSFPERVQLAQREWDAYVAANEAFADVAADLTLPGAPVWVHDYHLLLLGRSLRRRGHTGPVGLFVHVPFPGPGMLAILPWAEELILGMLEFDLIGFHTVDYVDSFLRCAAAIAGATVEGTTVRAGSRTTRVGAYPLGIYADAYRTTEDGPPHAEVTNLLQQTGGRRLILGVDRLDYTKGIPERLEAYARMFTLAPSWRRRVNLVQVSVPSRADVPAYADQRARVEGIVGRINGEYGDADWTPVRYLYRSYGIDVLRQLYRIADVGYVTPLRDGMNLVAKEFVAAQDPARPGVLMLSRFAGAARELGAALLTNPYFRDGMALDLVRALEMPLEERQRRHAALEAVVSRTTALGWAQDFLRDLHSAAGQPRASG